MFVKLLFLSITKFWQTMGRAAVIKLSLLKPSHSCLYRVVRARERQHPLHPPPQLRSLKSAQSPPKSNGRRWLRRQQMMLCRIKCFQIKRRSQLRLVLYPPNVTNIPSFYFYILWLENTNSLRTNGCKVWLNQVGLFFNQLFTC